MKKGRYTIARRTTQLSILLLFISGNVFGWNVLRGNLSSAKIMNAIPLSDPLAVLQNLFTGHIAASDLFIGAAIVLLFYAILGGRAFCAWVCPINIITDAAAGLRRSLPSVAISSWDFSRSARYWVIGISLILSGILEIAAYESINPIGMMHRGIMYGFGTGWTYLLAIFFFDMFGVKNGFCGHLCPVGGLYAIIGRYGLLRVGYNLQQCSMCMKCLEVCPEPQVLSIVGTLSSSVRSGECINCGRCVEVCDDNAVNFCNIYSDKLKH